MHSLILDHDDIQDVHMDVHGQKPFLRTGALEILEGDCFSTSILQGLGELHFTLIFIEIFKIRDSERCLYQNQNQVKNGHWNQDGSSIKFPHKF